MTPIQAQSLPAILAKRDVIGQAKTGSGKTAAFGLGVLNHLQVNNYRVQSLILCPTRELAEQVAKDIRRLARTIHNIKVLTLCGGMPVHPQRASLERGAHIVVGTPGRVEEHLRKGWMTLPSLTHFVLDEADRMLDMGFQADLEAISEYLPRRRQTLLFSATFPSNIEALANDLLSDPVRIEVASKENVSTIEQRFYRITNNERISATEKLLLSCAPTTAIVFCHTKKECQQLADDLKAEGFSAAAIHGDMDQRARNQTLVGFANRSITTLIATDVAARGLDIDDLELVINYQMSRDSEVHVHRVGRTGRKGKQGLACTFITESEEYKLAQLEDYTGQEYAIDELPSNKPSNLVPTTPPMVTLQIDGGKKQKVRPGDVVGALTGENGIPGSAIGQIDVFDFSTYVAVEQAYHRQASNKLTNGKLKGRQFRVRTVKF